MQIVKGNLLSQKEEEHSKSAILDLDKSINIIEGNFEDGQPNGSMMFCDENNNRKKIKFQNGRKMSEISVKTSNK